MQAGSAGKKAHNVKYVDARSRTDKRGEQRADKMRKKSSSKRKSGGQKPSKGKGGGQGPKKSVVKKKKVKAHTSRH